MKRNKAETFTVSFRLDGYHHGVLSERAAAQNLSPGEYARGLIHDALDNQHAAQTLEALHELRRELEHGLRTLKQHLRTATICLLTDAGNASLEAAEDLVNEHMTD